MNLERAKKRLGPHSAETTKIMRFAARHFGEKAGAGSKSQKLPQTQRWNGRQIRNAFQTAIALAESEAQKESEEVGREVQPVLRASHFKVVFETSTEFDRYMHRLYRKSDSKRAHEHYLRYDDFGQRMEAENPYKTREELQQQLASRTRQNGRSDRGYSTRDRRQKSPRRPSRPSKYRSRSESESTATGSSYSSEDENSSVPSESGTDVSEPERDDRDDESTRGSDAGEPEEEFVEKEKPKAKASKSKKDTKTKESGKERGNEREGKGEHSHERKRDHSREKKREHGGKGKGSTTKTSSRSKR